MRSTSHIGVDKTFVHCTAVGDVRQPWLTSFLGCIVYFLCFIDSEELTSPFMKDTENEGKDGS